MYDWIEFVICYGEGFTSQQIKELQDLRKVEVAFTRQLILYFANKYKKECGGSLKNIGSRYGKNHSTVLHAIKVIENYIETDKTKCAKIKYYEQLIGSIYLLVPKNEAIQKQLIPLENEISYLEQRVINLQLTLSFLKKDRKSVV